VVAACFVLTFILGEAVYSFGVFFKPLESEFDWSRTLVSSGYTAFVIGLAISNITAGRLADRFSPRPILLGIALLTGLGISLCSQVHSIDQLRIFLFVAGLGLGATWSVPNSIVQRWFYNRDRAGLALAIVISGVGVGGLIFAPLMNHLILSYGWRNAFLIAGIFSFLVLVIPSFVIKRSPMSEAMVSEEQGSSAKSVNAQGWTTARIVTTASFVSITFIACVAELTFQVVSVHLVPHARDVGISPIASAAALGLIGGFSVPGRIVSGVIADKVGFQKALVLSFFGMALSLIWLLFLEATWMLYCFVFFYGICYGIAMTGEVGIVGQFFGMRSLGELIGITSAIALLVAAFAPYIAGFIFDTTGGYFMAFAGVMVLLLGAGFVATVMRKPQSASK